MRIIDFLLKKGEKMKEHSNCGIGVVANIDNTPHHNIVLDGIQILNRLEHRGGMLRDGSGDGAGIMTQIPRDFFKRVHGIDGNYYVAMTFLPKDEKKREVCEDVIRKTLNKEIMTILGIRKVPVKSEVLGNSAHKSMPEIYQYFIEDNKSEFDFYRVRREIEKNIYSRGIEKKDFYFVSFSNKTVVYKGLITPKQFNEFYLDLLEEDYKSAVVMVHQRFSTNTLPSWDLAHPFRILQHNGEINTISGNRNWIEARRSDSYSKDYSKESVEKLFPLTDSNNSDSANLDSVVEFMLKTGKNISEVLTTLVPSAWENNKSLEPKLKEYYEAKSLMMEPWDGPAGLITCTGDEVFAVLDRNGLRPMRYTLTKSGKLVISSEMGVLDTQFKDIKISGKLSAGEFLHLDLKAKKLLTREEIIERITASTNYKEEIRDIKYFEDKTTEPSLHMDEVNHEMERFSYTRDDLEVSIDYLQENQKEKVGSTTYDIALAAIDEDNPRLYFEYFRQKFAQVTNPPIDSIREATVFSIKSTYGSKKNLLDPCEPRGTIYSFDSPIVNNGVIEMIKSEGARSISTGFKSEIENAIQKVVDEAIFYAKKGCNIILSDRNTTRSIPILLISSAVHHALVEKGLRGRVGIAIESGEIREVAHYALLIGYGADIINPYLVLDYLHHKYSEISPYLKTIDKGIMKIMSKIGISSLSSYRGAKTFELIGVSKDVSDRFMGGTPTQIGGLTLEGIEKEILLRESKRYLSSKYIGEYTEVGRILKHKDSISNAKLLYDAIKSNNYNKYKEYSQCVSNSKTSIRDLLTFKGNPISIDEVEGEEDIISRFVASAMSFGALSKEAHENIAKAFNSVGASSNSGEGGEDTNRYLDNRISKVKQIASGRFGVNTNYLINANELQIKMAQGAKPGEGGHLPGRKVNGDISRIRNTVDGIDLISPPPHHDIYSIEDLAQLIHDLKSVNTEASISVKLASEAGVGIIASGTVKAGANKVVISGSEGGTGAATLSSLKCAATPWELGLSDTHKTLCENELRDLVKLQVDGGLRTGNDIVLSALLGADEYGLGTGLLMAQGCIMCRRCNTNSCPVGITTQKKKLRAKYHGSYEGIVTYLRFVAREARELLSSIGVRSIEEAIGRSSYITTKNLEGYKKEKLDLSEILREVYKPLESSCENKGIDPLNNLLLDRYLKNTNSYKGVINNTNRTIGATTSSSIQKDSNKGIFKKQDIELNGYSGQSFGAFAVEGQSITLEGYGNDYVAKGLSGGTIIIKKPLEIDGLAGCIVGNTVLYGATSGKLYLQGYAGERFAVRNSGALAIVEGIGNHGCEYMTGGKVVVLGEIGNNFGAGMSGGIAYLDKNYISLDNINNDTVQCFNLNDYDKKLLRKDLEDYYLATKSNRALKVLEDNLNSFIKVASPIYLEKIKEI